MPAFETIVRPSVLPNIRPKPAQKVVTFTDPGQGFAVIHGNAAKQLNLTHSQSQSISRSIGTEYQRRVDRMRVYQKNDDGSINKDNFLDIEVPNRLKFRDGSGTHTRYYKRQPEKDNIELLKKDLLYNSKGGGDLGSG
jgi:hypothetical protein